MSNKTQLTRHQYAFLSMAAKDSAKATLDFACKLFTHPEGSMKSRQAGGGLIASCTRLGLGSRVNGGYRLTSEGRAAVDAKEFKDTKTPMAVPGAGTDKAHQLKQAQELKKAGKSDTEIAKALGVHRSTVSRLLKPKAPTAAKGDLL